MIFKFWMLLKNSIKNTIGDLGKELEQEFFQSLSISFEFFFQTAKKTLVVLSFNNFPFRLESQGQVWRDLRRGKVERSS